MIKYILALAAAVALSVVIVSGAPAQTPVSPEKVCNTPAGFAKEADSLPEGFLKDRDVIVEQETIKLIVKSLEDRRVPQDAAYSRIDAFGFSNGASLIIFYEVWEDGRECAAGAVQIATNELYGRILRQATGE